MEFEKRGIPTIAWTGQAFVKDAMRSVENFGTPTIALATMPFPFTNQNPERIRRMVADNIDQVIQGLTEPPEV